jgi:aryl-phospho-beta-D-glucosidase BglC (GH1 family)
MPEEVSTNFLRVSGSDIIDSEGNIVRLTGVNAGGWLVIEEWMCPVTDGDGDTELTQFVMEDTFIGRFGRDNAEALLDAYYDNWWTDQDFINIKAMGFNVIRLPFTWRTFQNVDYTYRADAFIRLDWFIEKARENGLYVILDLHGAHGSQNGRHHSGDISTGGTLYTDETNMAQTEALWVTLAERYKDNDTVAGYDLLNEPEGTPGGEMNANTPQWDYYDRLYKAIREVDTNHIIIMEAIWEAINLPSPSLYSWENVVYEHHYYGWDNTGDFAYQKTFIDQKVFYNNLTDYSVPILVGEFSLFDNPESWEYGLGIFEQEGWNWTIWSYKVTGASSWGIYNLTDSALTANIYTEDYDTLMNKFSRLSTSESFTLNQMIFDAVKQN